jgi:hypothetical protein
VRAERENQSPRCDVFPRDDPESTDQEFLMRSTSSPPRVIAGVFAAVCMMALFAIPAAASTRHAAFGFNARDIAGFPTGSVTLTGGGAFDSATGFVDSAGGFRCTTTVNQGPLSGCLAGQGVRWDTANLLDATSFKCTGATGEALKSANTDTDTAVLGADFYRAGNGNDESFTANMIVAGHDIAPDIPGMQNVWVQGVGCAGADVHFNS